MQTEDMVIECCDCGEKFTFSSSEQVWYKEKCFDTPKRCSFCRRERRRKFKEMAARREAQHEG